MLRTARLFLGCALIAAPAAAQQLAPKQRMYPVTSPIRDAGTVDVTTGRWTRGGSALKLGSQLIYNNTCTWAGGAYYAGFDWCEEVYDEGRVPSTSSPSAPNGVENSNTLLSMQVSYCTSVGPTAGVGGYDMDVAFWDKLGGDCVGGVPPTPPPVSSTATAYFPLAGLGLPGSSAVGFTACWIVTLDLSNSGAVLASDGEGAFNGVGADDKFIWMQRQNATQASPGVGLPDGFFLAGDPAVGGYGACTYNIPCGTGTGGIPCGTGLDTFDTVWVNVDGIGVGGSGIPPGCPNSIAQYGFGTNCYFFGGYPANPLSSLYLALESDGRGPTVLQYCSQTKATSVAGCFATLDAPDTTLGGAWVAHDIARDASAGVGTSLGIFIYTDGVGIGPSAFSASVPFGTLCLSGFKRSSPACAPALVPNAQPGVCNFGPMSISIGCFAGALGIAVGEDVNVQLWYRDPTAANSGNANFSNAIFYTVQ